MVFGIPEDLPELTFDTALQQLADGCQAPKQTNSSCACATTPSASPAASTDTYAERPPVEAAFFVAFARTCGCHRLRGEVDLESSSSRPTLPDIRHRLVGRDQLIAAVLPGHPLTEGPLGLECYAAAEHLTISRRGRLRDPVDEALTTCGHERRVVAAAPIVAFALRLAPDTDLVLTLPDAATRAARERLGLITLPLPLQMPAIALYLLWHQRYDADRAHTWLRDLATEAVRTLFAPPTTSPLPSPFEPGSEG
ncbi:LysR substrate-binding domain-containing protein [Streptomyces sp. NPDC051315]|uniref:LysR substrate-binding domain-containing protein n=1 Tax=Streptomyces sp. NPDC051315 TaxID=3365650 RepID=UPI00379277BD